MGDVSSSNGDDASADHTHDATKPMQGSEFLDTVSDNADDLIEADVGVTIPVKKIDANANDMLEETIYAESHSTQYQCSYVSSEMSEKTLMTQSQQVVTHSTQNTGMYSEMQVPLDTRDQTLEGSYMLEFQNLGTGTIMEPELELIKAETERTPEFDAEPAAVTVTDETENTEANTEVPIVETSIEEEVAEKAESALVSESLHQTDREPAHDIGVQPESAEQPENDVTDEAELDDKELSPAADDTEVIETVAVDVSGSTPAEFDKEPAATDETELEAAEQSEDAPSDDAEVPVIEAVTEPEVAEAA